MTTSWVIIDRQSGRAILETFNPKILTMRLNPKYALIPILPYLQSLNTKTT